MLHNGTEISLRQPRASLPHPREWKMEDGGYLVGANGEVNGYDKRQLLNNMDRMFKAQSSGQMRRGFDVEATDEYKKKKQERREALAAAFHDKSNGSWQALGDAIGADIYQTANRDGFMRRLLMRADLEQGQQPRIRYVFKQNYAVAASSAAQIQPIMARNKFFFPPEYYVEDYIMVEERDINQTSSDLMEELLTDGEEATMVQEDKIWKMLAMNVVGIGNQQVNVIGSFTPQALQVMRSQFIGYNLPASKFLFASDLWSDFIVNPTFTQFYDPVSQYEIVQTGLIGRLLGLELISDAYRIPQLQVLNQGEMYLVSDPRYHGAYTDRGPVVANEIDGKANGMGTPSRGWYLYEELSTTILNPYSVVRGTRQ